MCLKLFYIDFWCSFIFISWKSVQKRTQRFWAEIEEVTTYGPHDDLSWLWRSVGVNRREKIMAAEWSLWPCVGLLKLTMIHPTHSLMLTKSSRSTQLQKIGSVVERSPSTDPRACNSLSHQSIEGNREFIKIINRKEVNMERWKTTTVHHEGRRLGRVFGRFFFKEISLFY